MLAGGGCCGVKPGGAGDVDPAGATLTGAPCEGGAAGGSEAAGGGDKAASCADVVTVVAAPTAGGGVLAADRASPAVQQM